MSREILSTRPAAAEDAPRIVRMHRALAQHCSYPRYFVQPEQQVRATIQDEQSHGMYIVAEHNYLDGFQNDVDVFSEAAGYARVGKSPMSLSGNRGLIIDDLYVDPELVRHYDIGISLLARAAELAIEFAEGNPDSAFLRVDTANGNNDPTLRQYDGRGFEGNNTNLRLQGESLKELASRALMTHIVYEPLRVVH